MSPQRLDDQLAFLRTIGALKSVERATSLLDESRRENTAEHSWHLAVYVLVLAEHANDTFDLAKALQMAILHDIVEVEVGDAIIYDEAERDHKAALEPAAASKLFGMLPAEQGERFCALWEEYEAKETPEARFVYACDRLQPSLHNRNTGGRVWAAHGVRRTDVVNKNQGIANGSTVLWDHLEHELEAAVAEGILRD